tara:strand:+ start:56623 stop:57546 length:924 start_codon:yes stop_codon:yes gene_type:complete
MTQTVNTKAHTDIKRLDWIEKSLPVKFRPYAYVMRLDRPIGVWLLLLPSLWSIALSSDGLRGMGLREYAILLLFIIGAIVMRGAGCIINDLWDRDIDKKVERTRERPIASGQISIKQALVFLATLLLIGFIILLQFNVTTIILGFLTLPLIISYPLMKRITWWPQFFLGLTFNFGALMGWSAVAGSLSMPAILLYIGALFWTIAYDTIYAHQDKDDDALIGVKSTALKFGEHSKIWVSGFLSAAFVLLCMGLWINAGIDILSGGALLCLGGHFIWQMTVWKPDDQESSLMIFKANRNAGLLILLSCL